jgi:hypothetical protein
MNAFRVLPQAGMSAGVALGRLRKKGTGYVIRRKFAELVAHHLLSNGHVVVDLAVVHLELEPDKIG